MHKKILLLFSVMILYLAMSVAFASSGEQQDLKVLVIEINPILYSITNKRKYPNNNGHPKVSEYFGNNTNKAIEELQQDLEFASHGYLNIIMTYEYLNEFPTYTGYVQGTNSHRFTEDLYISLSASDTYLDTGDWSKMISNVVNMVGDYSFDYEYIIQKFDLINRRNAGEFDMVWLNTIDPAQTYETMMVGRSAYWINGVPLTKDCKNFVIANIAISRRDANLHALGHGFEGIMSMAFNGKANEYNRHFNDETEEKYRALNLWEQFSMSAYESAGNNSGIGNVHFPFNSNEGYGYTKTDKVYSYWRNWLNYPNLSGEKILSDSSDWLEWEKNTSLGVGQNKDPDRLYMRLWFYLFPHVKGVTQDGYFNNWWKYFVNLEYAEKVKCKYKTKTYTNTISDSLFKVYYDSGAEKDISFQSDFASVVIEKPTILNINDNNQLVALRTGNTKLTSYVDGKFADYSVKVTSLTSGDYKITLNEIVYPESIELIGNTLLKLVNNEKDVEVIINAEKPQPTFLVKYTDDSQEELPATSDKIGIVIDDESVCKINSSGDLEMYKLGNAIMTCSAGSVSREYKIKVQTTACILFITESITNSEEMPYSIYANVNGKLENVPTPIPSSSCRAFAGWYPYYHQTISIENYTFTENYTYIVPKFVDNHNFGEWEVVLEPTIAHTGKKRRFCSKCNKKEEVTIATLDYVLGDIDDDGEVTIIDLRLLLQKIINWSSGPVAWTDEELLLMDVDNNHSIEVIDLRLLLQEIIN